MFNFSIVAPNPKINEGNSIFVDYLLYGVGAIALLGIGAVIKILARGNPGVVASTINELAIGTRISNGYRNFQLTSWFNLDLNPPTESLVYGATHPN